MLFGSWQDLFRTVASCIAPEMADRPNYALASVLDDMDQPSANGDAAHTATANGHSSEAQLQDAVQGTSWQTAIDCRKAGLATVLHHVLPIAPHCT